MIRELPSETVLALTYDWEFWARPEQLEPTIPWLVWALITGRGFGKTRVGSETIRKYVSTKRAKAIALIAPTTADVRDTMIGLKPGAESGLLQVCPPWDRPTYRPSYRDIVWDSGAAATIFSGEEPDRLRGPQHDIVWWDEPAATPHTDDIESNALFGLRLGEAKMIVTGTPTPIPFIRRLKKDAKRTKEEDSSLGVFVVTGSMYDNPFLAPSMQRTIIRRYEGTRLGRQEIYGDVLDDNPDAVFKQSDIDNNAITPDVFNEKLASGEIELKRIVIPVDPATTKKKNSNLTGIVPCAIDMQKPPHAYVLDDLTRSDSPKGWATVVIRAYNKYHADRVVAETNNGGDMVEDVIRQVDPNVSYLSVTATRGKILRAEPVGALYEQGRVHHVRYMGPADPDAHNNPNKLVALEEQMTTYDGSQDSPDRLDSLVWGITDLIINNENSAEDAIEYLERRSAKCDSCATLNYMPPGQEVVFCRSCGSMVQARHTNVDPIAVAAEA